MKTFFSILSFLCCRHIFQLQFSIQSISRCLEFPSFFQFGFPPFDFDFDKRMLRCLKNTPHTGTHTWCDLSSSSSSFSSHSHSFLIIHISHWLGKFPPHTHPSQFPLETFNVVCVSSRRAGKMIRFIRVGLCRCCRRGKKCWWCEDWGFVCSRMCASLKLKWMPEKEKRRWKLAVESSLAWWIAGEELFPSGTLESSLLCHIRKAKSLSI